MTRRERDLDSAPRLGRVDGLAYACFDPPVAPRGAVVILHGAGSSKESHFDFARAARAAGLQALAYDQRGHGASAGPLDHRALDDVATIVSLLSDVPLGLRGSSMGATLALAAADALGAQAVVAICPASADALALGLRREALGFSAGPGLAELFAAHDPLVMAARFSGDLLLMHAEGDERVAVAHSHALHAASCSRRKRLIVVPGGHHRSVQHDPELQGESIAFLTAALAVEANPQRPPP